MKQIISRYICVFLIFITLVIGIDFAVTYFNSVDIRDTSNIIEYISTKDNISDISILKENKSGELFSVLYKDKNSVRLIILEETNIPNRYKFFGGSYTRQSFSTFNFRDSEGALIIVFGDNSVIHASKYSMENGGITYSENIDNMDYVLRIYRIPDSNNINSIIYLYDSNNYQIGVY